MQNKKNEKLETIKKRNPKSINNLSRAFLSTVVSPISDDVSGKMEVENLLKLQSEEGVFKGLYEYAKPIIWVVKVTGEVGRKSVKKVMSAFAVGRSGYLMTSTVGGWQRWRSMSIFARRLSDIGGFKLVATLVEVKLNSCLALLKISPVNSDGIVCGKFGSGDVDVCETVMSIGHPHELVGSGLIGYVAYACVGNNQDYTLSDKRTCERYKSNSFLHTPRYRIMGHICHSSQPTVGGDHEFEKNLQAYLPIVQCTGLVGGEGISGAPMFNMQGEIIGMYVFEKFGYNIGIHVTALNAFWEEFLGSKIASEASKESKKDRDPSTAVSKRMKF